MMKTNPSEVFLLQKIDQVSRNNLGQGVSLETILEGIDDKYSMHVIKTLRRLKNTGVLEVISHLNQPYYKLTGSFEGCSEEVKHYVKHRRIPG